MAKVVCGCIYVHRSNIGELINYLEKKNDMNEVARKADDILRAKLHLMTYQKFNFEVIKYDLKEHKITFIDSPDWIIANEPEVGDGWRCDLNTFKWKFIPKRKKNPQIYHGKWRFVDQSFYTDFDVIAAYNREQQWQSIPGIKKVKSKIGNKNFWVEFLHANGMEV